MATFKFNAFGVSYTDVLECFGPRAVNIADVAARTRTVASSSTTTQVYLDSTDGLSAGDKVNINTGSFPEDGETRTIATVGSDYVTVTAAFSSAPVSGDVLNDGPEQVEQCMLESEAEVESKLPDRYRELLTHVEGEVIVRSATSGQTTATLCNITNPFCDSPGSVKLYRNYRDAWTDRDPSDDMDSSGFSVSGRTVTFTGGLVEDDQIVAEYTHDLDTPPTILAETLKAFAAFRVAQRAHLDHESNEVAWVAEMQRRAEDRMSGFMGGQRIQTRARGVVQETIPRGIPEFDDLTLIADWRREPVQGITAGHIHLA